MSALKNLKAGNILEYTGQNKSFLSALCFVERIEKDDIWVNLNGQIASCKAEDLNPVPINKTALLKLGFTPLTGNWFTREEDKIVCLFSDEGFQFSKWQGEFSLCNYHHELQNWYAENFGHPLDSHSGADFRTPLFSFN